MSYFPTNTDIKCNDKFKHILSLVTGTAKQLKLLTIIVAAAKYENVSIHDSHGDKLQTSKDETG